MKRLLGASSSEIKVSSVMAGGVDPSVAAGHDSPQPSQSAQDGTHRGHRRSYKHHKNNGHHHGGHDHGGGCCHGCTVPTLLGRTQSLLVMLSLTTMFFIVEIVVGYMTDSMALVADAFHMMSDIISLLVGFFALRLSKKTGLKTGKGIESTFGWARAEVLGALINSVFMLALCFTIIIESIKRFVSYEPIKNPLNVIIVGAVGLLVNIIGMFMFHGHSHGHSHHAPYPDDAYMLTHDYKNENRYTTGGIENAAHETDKGEPSGCSSTPDGGHGDTDTSSCPPSVRVVVDTHTSDAEGITQDHSSKHTQSAQLNMKGVYLHILGDAMGSIVVIISSTVIYFYENKKWAHYLDPVMSLIIAMILVKSSVPICREASMILMQMVPTHIQMASLRKRLQDEFPDIVGVHEFHVWQLTGSKIIASAHLKFSTQRDYLRLCEPVKNFFHLEGIHSTTVQPEFVQPDDLSEEEPSDFTMEDCLLMCAQDSCLERTCCGETHLTQRKVKNSVSAVQVDEPANRHRSE